jgi:hypothetical protein
LFPGDLEFITKTKDDISDIIYDYDEQAISMHDMMQSRDAEYDFDKIDFVFIDTDITNVMPWHSDWEKIAIFLKNCIKANKCVFGSTVVFNTLIYLSSLGD